MQVRTPDEVLIATIMDMQARGLMVTPKSLRDEGCRGHEHHIHRILAKVRRLQGVDSPVLSIESAQWFGRETKRMRRVAQRLELFLMRVGKQRAEEGRREHVRLFA